MSGEIKTVGVCGAGGTMGAGIAIVAARAGFNVICYDTAEEPLNRAVKQTEAFFQKSVERGKMSEADRDTVLARFQRTTDIGKLTEIGRAHV